MGKKIEIWGGVECTVNRVQADYFDQLVLSGHDRRIDDLNRFADLGLRTLRYPVIWERIAPDHPDELDWSWTDERLQHARDLGIKIIAGLVHHGSGPRYTSLLDSHFPEKLAAFAARVAERYPWIDAYTPINEPLTTARFSGLYGHWYPHKIDHRAFLKMLLAECRGTQLAMRAVRAVNPEAILVQTEDMGKIWSTPFLSYEADFENERRWLSLDLLTGRFGPGHPIWAYFRETGLDERDVETFWDGPCPPDIVGINHYVTSNRFLDERQERYPACYHGGNESHQYADIEAVLIGAENVVGHAEVLRETWERYQLPLAITETHIGSTRDEQLRWVSESWRAAHQLQTEGLDVRAVAVWALLGSYDWDCLVTRLNGFYEPGVFDLRSGSPRPTALAGMVKSMARAEPFDHPALDMPGWWHRPDRLRFSPINLRGGRSATTVLHLPVSVSRPRELMITGSPGPLATAFAYICERRGLPFRLYSRRDFDISNVDAVNSVLKEVRPWALINAAGYSRIDDAEEDLEGCRRDNVLGPIVLAQSCSEFGIRFVTFSSHLVFDGQQNSPYLESSLPAPLNFYGQSKVEAEKAVLSFLEEALVIRSGAFFGPWDEANFLTSSLKRLYCAREARVPTDITISPSYLPDLVDTCLDLMIDGEKGLWHLANQGEISWASFTREAAKACQLSLQNLKELSTSEIQFRAPRPLFSAISSERARLLPELDHALARYAKNCRVTLGRRIFDPAARA